MDELNKLLASKKNTVSILHEKPVLYDCRPNIAEVLHSQAVVDNCESEIRRMHTANQHLKKGENTLAEFYLGRKLEPEEKNTFVQHALNDIVYTTSNEISSKKKEILNKNIEEMKDNLKNDTMPLSAPKKTTAELAAEATIKTDSSLYDFDFEQEEKELNDLSHYASQNPEDDDDEEKYISPKFKPDIDPIWGWDPAAKHTKKETMQQANILGIINLIPKDATLAEAEKIVSRKVLEVQHQTGGLDSKRIEELAYAEVAVDEFKSSSSGKKTIKQDFRTEMLKYGINVSTKGTFEEMQRKAKQDIHLQRELINKRAEYGQTGSGLTQFGTHLFDSRKLNQLNVLSLRKTHKSKAAKQVVVSDALKQAILENKPNQFLTEEEVNYFDYLCKRVHLTPVHKLKQSKLSTTAADNNKLQLKILMGSVQSGNDNPQLLDQLKKLVSVMAAKHQLTSKQIDQINLFI